MDNAVVNVDGTIYSIAGGDGSASTASGLRLRPGDPRVDAARRPARGPQRRGGRCRRRHDRGHRWLGRRRSRRSTPGSTTRPATPGRRWPTHRWRSSASGQAVLDGKLYTVGGCTTADCLPMSNAVAAYDVASDSWQELADYPDSVAFASCGGIDGQVYCTGGNDGNAASTATYAYDPSADSWSPVADAPVDLWASASASAGGTLVVTGGVQGGAITNAAFAYDPASDSWTDLPNSNVARYRGGAACGFYKVGGSEGSFAATAGQRDAAGSGGLRRRRRGRRVAVGRPHHGDPAAGPVDDGHRHHRPERAAAGRLHGRGHDRRGRPRQRRRGGGDDDGHPARGLGQARRDGQGHLLRRQRRHRSPGPRSRSTRGPGPGRW